MLIHRDYYIFTSTLFSISEPADSMKSHTGHLLWSLEILDQMYAASCGISYTSCGQFSWLTKSGV